MSHVYEDIESAGNNNLLCVYSLVCVLCSYASEMWFKIKMEKSFMFKTCHLLSSELLTSLLTSPSNEICSPAVWTHLMERHWGEKNKQKNKQTFDLGCSHWNKWRKNPCCFSETPEQQNNFPLQEADYCRNPVSCVLPPLAHSCSLTLCVLTICTI